MAIRAGLDYATIVQAAAELADQNGLHGFTMAALAAHLKVSSPTLYHYFAGLADLQRALSLLAIAEISKRLGRAVMGKAGDEAVLALAYTLRDFSKDRPGLYAAAQYAPSPEDEEWRAGGREVIEIMARALSAYHLSETETTHVIRMLRSIVHGFVSLESIGGFGIPLDVDETFRRLLDSLLSYLAKQHPL